MNTSMGRMMAIRKTTRLAARAVANMNTKTKPDWDRAVSEGEKIVGYQPFFANLGRLLTDEVAYDDVNHPTLNTIKKLLYNDTKANQCWGLLMLLVSKTAGMVQSAKTLDQSDEGGVLLSQRALAEVIEMIRTGNLIHKGILNLSFEEQPENVENLNFGNKIALLAGDYLLVKANNRLFSLRNQHVSELISSALRDLTECEFIGDRDPQNLPIPSRPIPESEIVIKSENDSKITSLLGNLSTVIPLNGDDCIGYPVRDWTLRNMLGGGSLLGKGCEGSMCLAGHDNEFQRIAYFFGTHVALAWQASVEYNSVAFSQNASFNLVSAPVLFALHHRPSAYELVDAAKNGVENVDFGALKKVIKDGPALDYTLELYNEHSSKALELLQLLPETDASGALKNIILAMISQ